MSAIDVVDAVVYADVFGCAAGEDDVWRYSRTPLDRDALRAQLAELDGVVRARDGLVCLLGREERLAEAPARRRRAARLHRRARRVARVVQHAPFVRGLLLTGSAAAGEAGRGADPDVLVLVAPGRLGTAFALLGTLARLTGGRALCPNHYRSIDHPAIEERDLYVAREFAQAWPLSGEAATFLAANTWTRGLLPNAAPRRGGVRPLPLGRLFQRAAEALLHARIEPRMRRLARSRLYAHHGAAPPADILVALDAGVELRFHAAPVHSQVLDSYEERRAALEREVAG
jgi:predicted nucleotidyltransferase